MVDSFRYRNKLDLHLAREGLREGLRRRAFTVDQQTIYIIHGRVWTVMRPYLEAMVADDA